MKCPICGGSTWVDDDLHWQWCKNNAGYKGICPNSYGGDNDVMDDYQQAINDRDAWRKMKSDEDGY